MALVLKIEVTYESGFEVEVEPSWWMTGELLKKYNFKSQTDYYMDEILYVQKSAFLEIVSDQEKYIDKGVYSYDGWKGINQKTKIRLDEIVAGLSETDKIKIWIYEWESGGVKVPKAITKHEIPDANPSLETVAEINKQDNILSQIGLKRLIICQPPNYSSVYAKSQFKNYVTSEYEESQRKETDEAYRMPEFNLLHIDYGLRLTLAKLESYEGEIEECKVIRMYITTSSNKELEVLDADFENKIFYTTDLEIPFSEINNLIE